MADYKSYLAASVLTEDKVVTYRLLSRVLKVHVNDAKEMLYDFHKKQNQKKPGTVHATYLVSGKKRKEAPPATIGGVKDVDGDDYMQSSPFMSSSMPQPEEDQGTGESSVLSIILTREEDLEKIRSQYEQINSIHIYSIEPHPLKDLQILSDVTRELQELCASEDPLESLSKYGTITNPSAKRRATRKPPAPTPAATQYKPLPSKAKPAEAKPAPKKEEPKSQPSTAKDFFGKGKAKEPAKSKTTASSASSKESTPNPPGLKKESSGLFKSFAKAKPKAKHEGTDSPAASPALSPAEDSPMKDVVSSDDDDEPFVPAPPKEEIDRNRRKKKEREEALRKMMEDDDEDEPVPTAKVVESEEEEEAPKAKSKSASVEKEEPSVVSGGRRRGRRRVMKKKTVKDEEGYLVTKEEMAWESFSEDEPVAKPMPKPQASTATKKKPAGKAGQGSIMSFFGKK